MSIFVAKAPFITSNGVGRAGGDWFNASTYSDLAVIADFNNRRYAMPSLSAADIAGATAAQLCVKRAATFAEVITFTSASTTTRTYFDEGGTLRSDSLVNVPTFDFANGKRQLRLDAPGVNELSSETATQSLTVTAAARTLSFIGTGTVTLSGASTAGPLVGTGATNRVSLIFTPSAGTLTLTVSGSVQRMQLDTTPYLTPFIGAGGTRAADNAQLSATALALLQRTAASFVFKGQNAINPVAQPMLAVNGGYLLRGAGTAPVTVVGTDSPSGTLFCSGLGTQIASSAFAAGVAFDATGRSLVRNGHTLSSDANQPYSRSSNYIGRAAAIYCQLHVDAILIAPSRLSNARLTALSVP